MKSIDTFYNGNYYRSRLEARWAVFFDEIGVKYQYEPEGYKLNNGKRYLPDFYFPVYECYGEVKPEKIEDARWKDFVIGIKKSLIIFTGNTFGKSQILLEYYKDNDGYESIGENDVIPFADRFYKKYHHHFYGQEDWSNDHNVKDSVFIAQTIRFEHKY
jgi:hypothetical protein